MLAIFLLIGSAATLVVYVIKANAGRPDGYVDSKGVVIEVHETRKPGGEAGTKRDWDTDVRFETSDSSVEFRSEFGSSSTEVGDTIPVFYDPADPQATAETDSDRQPEQWLAVTVVLGFVGLGVVIFERPRRRGADQTPKAPKGSRHGRPPV